VRIAQASQGDEIFLSIHAENARLDDGTFDTGDTFRARVGNTFQSGVHELSSADRAALAAEVDRLVAFLEEHQARDKPVTVTITGGESRVPNPEGFGPGELAAARSRAAMEEIAALLEARGFELGNIRFAVQEPVIGRTPFRAGADSAKAEKFTREQFIDVTVRVEE
jgi:sugar phosphate isomerase/epimerase